MTGPDPATPPVVRRLGPATATLVVVASMIGTGVFTTTGFLVQDIASPQAVLLAWLLGGFIALFGALSYGELAATIARNGGEYRFLSDIYHPGVGFIAGWVSLVVGFSAPIAASSLAFGEYTSALVPAIDPRLAGAVLIVLAALAHAVRVDVGARLQNGFTALKVALIATFVVGGVLARGDAAGSFASTGGLGGAVLSPGFAVGLIFISFAYSGWNGAAYVAGEVRDPSRNLPLALAVGTAVVTVLYVAINAVFLASAPATELAGEVEVGHIAAVRLFGPAAGSLLSGLIALALVSAVSAMMMVGPRVYEAMGEDYRALGFLRTRPERGGPVASIALQAAIALVMLMTSSFGALLTYIGVTLSISAALTVAGVFVLRVREPGRPRPYRTWGFPATSGLFVLFSCWMVAHAIFARPVQALAAAATVAAGGVLYLALRGGQLGRSRESRNSSGT